MKFVMYVDGKQVDTIELLTGNIKVSELINLLRNKHRELLKKATSEPVFAIEHAPSSINSFQPLKLRSSREQELEKD